MLRPTSRLPKVLRLALVGTATALALTATAASASSNFAKARDLDGRAYGLPIAELAVIERLQTTNAVAVHADDGHDHGKPAADAARFTPSSRGQGFLTPVVGRLTTPFGERGPYWKLGYHPGMDLAAPVGTPIKATAGGVVIEAEGGGWNNGYGHYVKIDHGNGLHSLYAHMSTVAVEVGTYVERGEVIGRVGNTGVSTGPHLHLEIRQDGKKLDPATYLR